MFSGFRLTHSSDSFVRPNKDRDRARETADHVFVRDRERERAKETAARNRDTLKQLGSRQLNSAGWLAGWLLWAFPEKFPLYSN